MLLARRLRATRVYTPLVELRDARDKDRPQIARIWSEVLDPGVTAETLAQWASLRVASEPRERKVARVDGAIVGFSTSVVRDGTCTSWVAVDPRFRRRGVGGALFAACVSFARAHPIASMAVTARDDEAEAFACRRGFVARARMQMWSLDLGSAPLPADVPVPARVEVTSGAERSIDVREAAAISRALYADATDAAEELAAQVFGRDGEHSHLQVVARVDERIVGVAWMQRVPGTDRAYHGLTAVAEEHRRRGIARSMKLRQLRAARDAGIVHVTTGNDVTNVAALAMNASLGYRPTRIDRELRLAVTR